MSNNRLWDRMNDAYLRLTILDKFIEATIVRQRWLAWARRQVRHGRSVA